MELQQPFLLIRQYLRLLTYTRVCFLGLATVVHVVHFGSVMCTAM